MKLKKLPELKELSLLDIHFKPTPLFSSNTPSNTQDYAGGYKDFVVLHLPQIQILDGISLQPSHRQKATLTYTEIIGNYNAQLSLLETSYQKEISSLLHAKHVSNKDYFVIGNIAYFKCFLEARGLFISV